MGEFRVISVLSPREPTRGPREAGRLLMARFGGPAAGTNSPTTADPQNGVNVSSSAGEKSQLQALGRGHETVPAARGRPALVEFEYRCGVTLACLAAWDVHPANLLERVEAKTGIEPFGRLVRQVMATEP